MVEQDTIRLLRECDAGIKMGISAIDEVMEYAHSDEMRAYLQDSSKENQKLQDDLQEVLADYHDNGKEPSAIASGMSWVKTNFKLKMENSDSTIAELMTDGCNMGIKSLSRYLNQYQAADRRSKDLTKRLIKAEEKLSQNMRAFL